MTLQVPDISTPPSKSNSLKLQAFLAHAGIASRRQAEVLIREQKITVNGQPATIGQRIIPGTDLVRYQGKVIELSEPPLYVLVHKPAGLVSTTSDELGRATVLSLLPAELRTHRLYPVGRLDQDSQGLLLLTNDGDLAYRLTHPKFKVKKTYLCKLDRSPTQKALEVMRRGVRLTDGKTAPAKVTQVDDPMWDKWLDDDTDRWYSVTIHEGRNRQVRRMWERVGYNVEKLVRVSMGPLTLDQLHDHSLKILSHEESQLLRQKLIRS